MNKVNRQLLQTEKLATLGYFAAGVAREIAIPINNILDNLPLLQQRLGPTPENIKLLSSLEQEALRGKQIIQSLCDFSIQKEYHPETADLNQLIEAAWSKYHEDYDSSDKVEFVRGFDPALPPVSLDSKQIQQALFYLIRNAYRAMPGGGTLRIISRAVGYTVQIIISDSGPGIAQEEMRHIFEPFYRGVISVNGAAAHCASPGDLVIICAYGVCDEAEMVKHKPTLVYVDRQNQLTHTNHSMPAQAAA